MGPLTHTPGVLTQRISKALIAAKEAAKQRQIQMEQEAKAKAAEEAVEEEKKRREAAVAAQARSDAQRRIQQIV